MEESLTKIVYLEAVGLAVLLLWNLINIIKPQEAESDKGERLGAGQADNGWWRWGKKKCTLIARRIFNRQIFEISKNSLTRDGWESTL